MAEPKILEGKTLAAQIRGGLSPRIEKAAAIKGRKPFLSAISCPGDEGADLYLKKELEACAKIGIETQEHRVRRDCDAPDFIRLLREISNDKSVVAILIPRPLPPQLSAPHIWENLNPAKDIDGASTLNMGLLFLCKSYGEIEKSGFFVPCTALAVIRLLRYHNIEISGKMAVVLGRSSTVGRPLAHMLACWDATVTLCHSKTPDIANILLNSELIASAIGKARWVKGEMIRPGAIVADVGTNTDENGVFCGDVDYKEAAKRASAISPVPGGVGPVTLACLLENIVTAFERN